jgi:hypothetical protein
LYFVKKVVGVFVRFLCATSVGEHGQRVLASGDF